MQTIGISLLNPPIVWKHFAILCEIPRASKQEARVRTHIRDWAENRGLWTYVDRAGNLIIRKPAKPGKEQVPGVVLQAHLDMVTQANQGTIHDFANDPITPILEDDWLIAQDTTLGADNGIGVALALAALEDETLEHGLLEVLLTVDEEAGMSGALNLEPNVLQAQWLFNIDTEEWGELYLGCAGSVDVQVQQSMVNAATAKDGLGLSIQVNGLRGGHSGVNIHLGRGNANVILPQLLADIVEQFDVQLVQYSGGNARNAIAREAAAVLVIRAEDQAAIERVINRVQALWLERLAGKDEQLQINCQIVERPETGLSSADQNRWLAAFATLPYGVHCMSSELPDVVQTSNNIGVLHLDAGETSAVLMVRSLDNEEVQAFGSQLVAHFTQYAIQAELTGMVSGWRPDAQSAALLCLQNAYRTRFGIEPKLQVIHAGLECGIIAQHYPHLQMVSFGPTIQSPHAPGERVKISTVASCWSLLKQALVLVS